MQGPVLIKNRGRKAPTATTPSITVLTPRSYMHIVSQGCNNTHYDITFCKVNSLRQLRTITNTKRHCHDLAFVRIKDTIKLSRTCNNADVNRLNDFAMLK
jgi:hypothetical protein